MCVWKTNKFLGSQLEAWGGHTGLQCQCKLYSELTKGSSDLPCLLVNKSTVETGKKTLEKASNNSSSCEGGSGSRSHMIYAPVFQRPGWTHFRGILRNLHWKILLNVFRGFDAPPSLPPKKPQTHTKNPQKNQKYQPTNQPTEPKQNKQQIKQRRKTHGLEL